MSKIRFVLTRDENVPTGGVRQAYRQVDILNELGYDAAIVAPREGFRCSWFDNDTKIVGPDEEVGEGDFLVLSEVLPCVPDIKGADRARIIVYAQNPFSILRGYGGISHLFDFYRDRVAGVMCVSDHSLEQISKLFPDNDVHRIRYSFDKPPFGFSPGRKEKRIVYMSRRRREDIEQALMIASQTDLLRGWRIESIEGKSETEVAELLKRAMIFISGSQLEGFGMPPAEAMVSGCVVVGWHGHGGSEFMLPGISYPIPEGDILACANTLKEVIAQPFEDLVNTGEMAAGYIKTRYTTEAEVLSVKEAWKAFTGKAIFPMSDVAAFVSTYDEGPYLDAVLRWLSPRVGKVYVVESKTSFHGAHAPEGERLTKKIVDRVAESGIDNVVYHVMEGKEHPGPDIKEAHERNQALEMIERDGFKWVWIVDSDEFYMNEEAENMWQWFLSMAEQNPDVMGAQCSWFTYWRSLFWRIDPPEQFHPNIIVRSSCRIASSRHLMPDQQRRIIDVPRDICMARHYSWAHTPSHIKRKLDTWTHAHQVVPGWFEDVFMGWTPECDAQNLHPAEPGAYQEVVRDEELLPEALRGHPYSALEVIQDRKKPVRIKAVILNYNCPENSDSLYDQLSPAFDDVEIFDSGSDPDKIPIHVGRSMKNIYWTGGWNEILKTCSDYDAVWMIGCDITLNGSPMEYRDAIVESLPFGCWSPCVEGRAKPFMSADNYTDLQPREVRNIEGMAMALSGRMMAEIKRLPSGSDGYGQDLWMCYKARELGLKNVIDGRVSVFHPEGTGYDDEKFHAQMEKVFGDMFGPDFRRTAFQYDDRYEHNLMEEDMHEHEVEDAKVVHEDPGAELMGKKHTIVTVDNGWSYPDFIRITNDFPESRKIIMTKGIAEIPPHEGIEIILYDKSMSLFLAEADVALFPKVGATTKSDLETLMKVGIPCVVHQDFSQGMIDHMKNGFVFGSNEWGKKWIQDIRDDPQHRQTVERFWNAGDPESEPKPEPDPQLALPPAPVITAAPQAKKVANLNPVKVTVITPTWKRDPAIIKRCIDSVRLQTMGEWEQLVCSNGPAEPVVEALIKQIGDPRVSYAHLGEPQASDDFGNSARKRMIEVASGDFIVFVDDDNIVLPDFMGEMYVRLLNAQDCDFAVCKIMHFGPLNESEVGPAPIVLKGDPVKLYHIDPLQVMVRTKVMREVGWDTDVGYLSDGVTLENLGQNRKCHRVNQVLGVHL